MFSLGIMYYNRDRQKCPLVKFSATGLPPSSARIPVACAQNPWRIQKVDPLTMGSSTLKTLMLWCRLQNSKVDPVFGSARSLGRLGQGCWLR